MKKLLNGWYVPEDDFRITRLVQDDNDMNTPSYEHRYRDLILKHIPSQNIFLDIGANIGIWSLPFIKKFKKVISYEPSKQNIECIKKNIPNKLNLIEKAAANFNGEADFHQAGKNCGDGKLCREGISRSYSVSVVKLDDENWQDVDLIKIDVQGWEYEVLLGATNIITSQNPWIIFEVNENVDKCCEYLENNGYEMILLKSKRMFLWAPLKGQKSPTDKSIFGRRMGPGPYASLLN